MGLAGYNGDMVSYIHYCEVFSLGLNDLMGYVRAFWMW